MPKREPHPKYGSLAWTVKPGEDYDPNPKTPRLKPDAFKDPKDGRTKA